MENTTCKSCDAGYYTETAGISMCAPCPIGTYMSNALGGDRNFPRSSCLLCPNAKEIAQKTCKNMEDGFQYLDNARKRTPYTNTSIKFSVFLRSRMSCRLFWLSKLYRRL